MSGTETIIPEDLTALAQNLAADVGPLLTAAEQSFTAAAVSGGSFSQVGLPMQIVYPGLRDWAVRDAHTKLSELDSVCSRLTATAELWSGADSCSTTTLEV